MEHYLFRYYMYEKTLCAELLLIYFCTKEKICTGKNMEVKNELLPDVTSQAREYT